MHTGKERLPLPPALDYNSHRSLQIDVKVTGPCVPLPPVVPALWPHLRKSILAEFEERWEKQERERGIVGSIKTMITTSERRRLLSSSCMPAYRRVSRAMSSNRWVEISLQEVYNLTNSSLLREGASQEHASSVADCVRNAERDGSSSHGLYRVPGYIRSLRSGKVKGKADPSLTRVNDALLRCEGDNSFVSLVHHRYLDKVIQAARNHGVCIFAARRIAHWAALWPETEAIADAGLVAFACTSYLPTVAPHGTRRPFFGTNPVSFAWPRPNQPPLVFDMATSSSSLGDLSLKARMGQQVPHGTGLDSQGNLSQEPAEILKGCLLPFGGYKGSHLAMAVELLAGPLIGETTSYETAAGDNGDGGPPLGGELIVAMSMEVISGSKDSAGAAERFLHELGGTESFRMPGKRRHERRKDTGTRRIDAVTIEEIESLLR